MLSQTILGKPARMSAIAGVAAFTLAAFGPSASPGPAAPGPSPSTTVVAVTGSPASADSVQLTATAQFSDGAIRDVSGAAQWESSNASLATVSSTGLVAICRRGGEVEFRATYQSVTGSMRLLVIQTPSRARADSAFDVVPTARKGPALPRESSEAPVTRSILTLH